MREQAALLGNKTQNLVEATVETGTQFGRFKHPFLLLVPALGLYKYELFKIEHGVDLYPVSVSGRKEDQQLDNEQEFVDWLKAKLCDPETKKLIGNLLGMVTK